MASYGYIFQWRIGTAKGAIFICNGDFQFQAVAFDLTDCSPELQTVLKTTSQISRVMDCPAPPGTIRIQCQVIFDATGLHAINIS